MRLKHVVAGIIVVLLLVGGLVGAIETVPDIAPETDSASESDSESENDSGGEVERRPAEPTATPMAVSEPAFSFTVGEIENCGLTCRDVTATVTNTGNGTASNVTVSTRLFAGENTTDPEALIWEDSEDVGTLDGGESYTTTEQLSLSLQEASQVRQTDGWITIQTTVESEERTVTFQRSRQVL